MAFYTIGNTSPTITYDAGAGAWNSKKTEASMVAMKMLLINYYAHFYTIIGDDAANHLSHYLSNTGKEYEFDLKDMINDVPTAKQIFDLELAKAKSFVETLPPGDHEIVASKLTQGYNYKNENWNWFYAVGGYSVWGSGKAKILIDKSGKKAYSLDFEYNAVDRYNWDGGKSVKIFNITITDDFMGEFHRQGLAREYNLRDTINSTVRWGDPTVLSTLAAINNGR